MIRMYEVNQNEMFTSHMAYRDIINNNFVFTTCFFGDDRVY